MTAGDERRRAAVETFNGLLEDGLADWTPLDYLVGVSLVAASADLRGADGLIDPACARSAFPWFTWPDERFTPGEVEDIYDELTRGDLLDPLRRALPECESVTSWDDPKTSMTSSGPEGVDLSGPEGFDLFAMGDQLDAFSWYSEANEGLSFHPRPAYQRGDDAGRRQLFEQEAKYWGLQWAWGTANVSLAEDFPDDLLAVVRAGAEHLGVAPWETGWLNEAIGDWDAERIASSAPVLADYLGSSQDDARTILDDLQRHPDVTPPTAHHRTAAWWIIEGKY